MRSLLSLAVIMTAVASCGKPETHSTPRTHKDAQFEQAVRWAESGCGVTIGVTNYQHETYQISWWERLTDQRSESEVRACVMQKIDEHQRSL